VMISTLYNVTMDSVVDRHPCISEAKLFQLTRRRIQRRPPIWIDEAARDFSMAEGPKIHDLARRSKMTSRDTEEMLKGLKRFWSRWKRSRRPIVLTIPYFSQEPNDSYTRLKTVERLYH